MNNQNLCYFEILGKKVYDICYSKIVGWSIFGREKKCKAAFNLSLWILAMPPSFIDWWLANPTVLPLDLANMTNKCYSDMTGFEILEFGDIRKSISYFKKMGLE